MKEAPPTAGDAGAIRAVLIGARVQGLGRAAGMGVLELFGPNGEDIGIHFQCPFRVQTDDVVVVGTRDMEYGLKGSGPKAFANYATIYDERARLLSGLFEHKPHTINEVHVSKLGDLTLEWLPKYSLTTYIDTAGRIESWRVLIKGGEHHVFPAETSDSSK